MLIFTANIAGWVVMQLQQLLSLALLFSVVPRTNQFAFSILSYVFEPIKRIFVDVLHYVPNLFTICIICAGVHYLIKLIRYLANEIEAERLKLGSFYADWAMPTYHIARFLLYAFMVAMIYPYLPGAKSGVYQGISVFVGLIVSLGSSTALGKCMSVLVFNSRRSLLYGGRPHRHIRT